VQGWRRPTGIGQGAVFRKDEVRSPRAAADDRPVFSGLSLGLAGRRCEQTWPASNIEPRRDAPNSAHPLRRQRRRRGGTIPPPPCDPSRAVEDALSTVCLACLFLPHSMARRRPPDAMSNGAVGPHGPAPRFTNDLALRNLVLPRGVLVCDCLRAGSRAAPFCLDVLARIVLYTSKSLTLLGAPRLMSSMERNARPCAPGQLWFSTIPTIPLTGAFILERLPSIFRLDQTELTSARRSDPSENRRKSGSDASRPCQPRHQSWELAQSASPRGQIRDAGPAIRLSIFQ